MRAPCGIAELQSVDLNGYPQWLLIRGQDVSRPLLLFLHGGPGESNMWLAHYTMQELEKSFVCVNSDQRGAGRSFRPGPPTETMTIDQFVQDTIALIELLRSRFGQQKVLLLGHSWGSVLAMKVAAARPDLLFAVVGMGQVVDMKRGEDLSYRYMLECAHAEHNRKAIRALSQLGGADTYRKDSKFVQHRWLVRYGEMMHVTDTGAIVSILLNTPECSILDCIAGLTMRDMKFSCRRMGDEIMGVNLLQKIRQLSVPVFFFAGMYDYTTPCVLVEQFYARLSAPYKKLIWFEREERLSRPKEIQPPQPRNHGGNRYRCERCGSEQVRIRRRVTIICQHCQHVEVLEESEHDQEPASDEPPEQDQGQAKNFTQAGSNLQDTLKPGSPPCAAQDAPTAGPCPLDDESAQEADQNDLHAAAELLLALAGEGQTHIVMPRHHASKYLEVGRRLSLADVPDHLSGGEARGARCSRLDGQTRGLCWDTDDTDGWQAVQEAARQLSEAGYLPVLEESPVGHGGHFWLIYDGLVDAEAARQQVYMLAPRLAQLAKPSEYWPPRRDETRKWNHVRLPGGRYTRPGVRTWCRLISVADGEVATDGRGAAKLLLSHQTPASIVPVAIGDQDDQEQGGGGALELPECPAMEQEEPATSDQDEARAARPAGPDSQWYAKYGNPEGQRLWFAWTPQYLAAWWNDRHSVDQLLPTERNGYGLARWRSERTASVAKRGERWADFGASARQSDGSPDTGDALELQVHLSGAPKPEVMREAARELLKTAREALERAAHEGSPVPVWLEDIITEAGRAHYARCAAQAGHEKVSRNTDASDPAMQPGQGQQAAPAPGQEDGATGGLPGFSLHRQDPPASKMLPCRGGEEYTEPALAVPSSSALMAEIERLEGIKQYGERQGWAALLIDGGEMIPPGRSAWLRFLWLSDEKDKQRRVYEYISGR